MPSLRIAFYAQNIAVIAFFGRLEEHVIKTAIAECSKRKVDGVVIDMANVTLMPSQALAAIIGLADKFNGGVRLVETDGCNQVALDLMGFKETFRFHVSVDEALAAMTGDDGTAETSH